MTHVSSRHCKQIIIIETLQTNHLPILNVWQSTCSWATRVRFVNSWADTFYLSVFLKIKTIYLGGQATRQDIYIHTHIYIHIYIFYVFIFVKYQNHTSRGPGNKTGKMYTHIHTYTNVLSIDSFFLNLKTILLGGQATRQEINIHNTYIYTPIYFLSIYIFFKIKLIHPGGQATRQDADFEQRIYQAHPSRRTRQFFFFFMYYVFHFLCVVDIGAIIGLASRETTVELLLRKEPYVCLGNSVLHLQRTRVECVYVCL